MKESANYNKLEGENIQCTLCPTGCIVAPQKRGVCRAFENRNGVLYSTMYRKIAALHNDPIEKKPLFHFYPGKNILSIGTTGCNMSCSFCQNFHLSHEYNPTTQSYHDFSAEKLVSLALQQSNNIGIAFTYNEPAIWYDYITDVAPLAAEANLKTVMVTNGYINPKPLGVLNTMIDAYNVDLKIWNPLKHKEITNAHRDPVLNTLKSIRKSGKHLEITHLVVTGINDNLSEFEEMVRWIVAELGKETILHLSRYFPNYKLSNPETSLQLLNEFFTIAKTHLDYVYLGNVESFNAGQTYCPKCSTLLINRHNYYVEKQHILPNGKCKNCNTQIMTNI